GAEVNVLQKLGFGKCTLKIAVKQGDELDPNFTLQNKTITTSYPNILKTYLRDNDLSAEIRTISGSVEIGPGLGLSDAIFDIVSTGATLKSNGLTPFADVMRSEAVLITGRQNPPCAQIEELLQRLRSVLHARSTKYVVLNVKRENLDKIAQLLPGVKSPTVVPLFEEGWVAVHSVIQEEDFWQKINSLKAAGAEGIVVMPIEKVII
ncbi:MAG: ATP phosphoribosyltransferase, partial [Chitinophagaceae bacterium]